MSSNFAQLFAVPGSKTLVVAGLLGRLPQGMLGLLLVLVVKDASGSYGVAGLGAAAYTAAVAVGNPCWSRLVDRRGPASILMLTGSSQCAMLAAIVVALPHASQTHQFVALGGAAGLFLPPIGALMRTLWSRTIQSPDAKSAAFAFESILVDVVFIVGPLIATTGSLFVESRFVLLAAGVMSLSACLLIVINPRLREMPTPERRTPTSWVGPLARAEVATLLPVALLLLGSIAVIEVSLVALADEAGSRGVAGVLIAAVSVGGVMGGLYWGARRHRTSAGRQLPGLLLLLSAGWALSGAGAPLLVLGALLFAAGVVLNPAITATFATMDGVAPTSSLTESFGWLNAAGSVGATMGAAAAGALLTVETSYGFFLAAAMCGTAFALSCASQPLWQRAGSRP